MLISRKYYVERTVTTTDEFADELEDHEQVDFILQDRFDNVSEVGNFFLAGHQSFDFGNGVSIRPIEGPIRGWLAIFANGVENFGGTFETESNGVRTLISFHANDMISVEIGQIFQIVLKLERPVNEQPLTIVDMADRNDNVQSLTPFTNIHFGDHHINSQDDSQTCILVGGFLFNKTMEFDLNLLVNPFFRFKRPQQKVSVKVRNRERQQTGHHRKRFNSKIDRHVHRPPLRKIL